MTAGTWIAGVAAVVGLSGVLGACSLDQSSDLGTPTTLSTTTTTGAPGATTPVVASTECRAAFQLGHDGEAAGTETFLAFRQSVQRCSSLAQWTAAAKDIGVDLGDQAAVFVDRTCSMADEATRARAICEEVKGKDR